MALLDTARRSGVTVAMGHSNASFEEASAAAERGICYAVHTFNAMRAFSHRDPGIVGASSDRRPDLCGDHCGRDSCRSACCRRYSRARKGRTRVLLGDRCDQRHRHAGRSTTAWAKIQSTSGNGVCRDREGRPCRKHADAGRRIAKFRRVDGVVIRRCAAGTDTESGAGTQAGKKRRSGTGNDADMRFWIRICKSS